MLRNISKHKAKRSEPQKEMEVRSKGPNTYGISKGEERTIRDKAISKNNQYKNFPILRPKSAKIPECQGYRGNSHMFPSTYEQII